MSDARSRAITLWFVHTGINYWKFWMSWCPDLAGTRNMRGIAQSWWKSQKITRWTKSWDFWVKFGGVQKRRRPKWTMLTKGASSRRLWTMRLSSTQPNRWNGIAAPYFHWSGKTWKSRTRNCGAATQAGFSKCSISSFFHGEKSEDFGPSNRHKGACSATTHSMDGWGRISPERLNQRESWSPQLVYVRIGSAEIKYQIWGCSYGQPFQQGTLGETPFGRKMVDRPSATRWVCFGGRTAISLNICFSWLFGTRVVCEIQRSQTPWREVLPARTPTAETGEKKKKNSK